jgi:hypothetical protein
MNDADTFIYSGGTFRAVGGRHDILQRTFYLAKDCEKGSTQVIRNVTQWRLTDSFPE